MRIRHLTCILAACCVAASAQTCDQPVPMHTASIVRASDSAILRHHPPSASWTPSTEETLQLELGNRDGTATFRIATICLWAEPAHKNFGHGAAVVAYSHGDLERGSRPVREKSGHRMVARVEASRSECNLRVAPIDGLVARRLFITPVLAPNDAHGNTKWRVTLTGCSVGDSTFYLSNGAHAVAHTKPDVWSAAVSLHLSMIMRSGGRDAVLLHARDMLLMQIRDGVLQVFIRTGLGHTYEMSSYQIINDNRWHMLELRRDARLGSFVLAIDGLVVNGTNGHSPPGVFARGLAGTVPVTVGGVPSEALAEYAHLGPVVVRGNFTGWLIDVKLNRLDLLMGDGVKRVGMVRSQDLDGDSTVSSEEATIAAAGSYIEKPIPTLSGASSDQMEIKFEFRTFARGSAHVFHMPLADGAHLKISSESGTATLDISGLGVAASLLHATAEDIFVADSRWRSVRILLARKSLFVFINDQLWRQLHSELLEPILEKEKFNGYMRLGGGTFIGCVRWLSVDGYMLHFSPSDLHAGQIEWGHCAVTQRCSVSACSGVGDCTQTGVDSHRCRCKHGFQGTSCSIVDPTVSQHAAAWPSSCSQHLSLGGELGAATIDIDGDGPLQPISVICTREHSHANLDEEQGPDVNTVVRVASTTATSNGAVAELRGAAGAARRTLTPDYGDAGDISGILSLIAASGKCAQPVNYACGRNAPIMNVNGASGVNGSVSARLWWLGPSAVPVFAWGDAMPDSRMCACGVRATCEHPDAVCNCDAINTQGGTEDGGHIFDKSHLPVTKVFVDGLTTPASQATVTVGHLTCSHSLFITPVTLLSRWAHLDVSLPSSERGAGSPTPSSMVSLQLDFRTAHGTGVIVSNAAGGGHEWFKIFLEDDGHNVTAQWSAAGGVHRMTAHVRTPLNDDRWHRLHFVAARGAAAALAVDAGHKRRALLVQSGPRALAVTPARMDWVWRLGNPVGERAAGMAGAVRSLIIDQQPILNLANLAGSAPKDDRVAAGLSRRCDSELGHKLCLNGGVCIEMYDDALCDCSGTPFGGQRCDREAAYTLQPGVQLRYTPQSGAVGTAASDANVYRFAFATRSDDCEIVQAGAFFADANLNVSLTEKGHLLYTLGVGARGRTHTLLDTRRRYNDGALYEISLTPRKNNIAIKLNNYEEQTVETSMPFDIKQLDRWAFGGKGFMGCVARVQIGPGGLGLKLSLGDTGGNGHRLTLQPASGRALPADTCGRVDVAQRMQLAADAQALLQQRDRLHVDAEPQDAPDGVGLVRIVAVTRDRRGDALYAALASVIVLVALVASCSLWLCWRRARAQRGEYKTHEDDPMYLTPDNSRSFLVQHNVPADARQTEIEGNGTLYVIGETQISPQVVRREIYI